MESLANAQLATERNGHKRKKGAEEEIDHFQRLPDELVVRIFEKVFEAKWLCMCYLVSRHFASLVLRTHSVSFKYTGWRLGKSCYTQHHSVVLPVVHNFLKKFVSIRSLHVEVLFGESPEDGEHDQYLIKWRSMGYLKNFIFIAAKRVITTADNDDTPTVGGTVEINAHEYSRNEIRSIEYKIRNHKIDSRFRYCMLEMIIGAFPHLKEAVVTDSLNQGLLFVGEADIDIMRRPILLSIFGSRMKLWLQPLLKLPLSGFLMEDAVLAIFKGIDNEDISMAENAFEEQKFCEAAIEMLKVKPYHDVLRTV